MSQLTGLTAMTPLGPSAGSIRSFSRTRVGQEAARLAAQKALSRQAKQLVLSSIEARTIQEVEQEREAAGTGAA